MTAAALFAVLWPLSRSVANVRRGAADVAVYRDQLAELERDRAAGLIGVAEAEAARIEVSRRLLAAADKEETPAASNTGRSDWRRRTVAAAVLILLPAGAVVTYLALGSPQMSGQPIAQRSAAGQGQASIETLVRQVEAHLERNPEDGRGWEVLAPVYMRLGRFDDAVKAKRNALRLLGPTADREADLGEALIGTANGIVTAEAKSAFERALVQDPRHAKSRFYMGLAAEQDGKPALAAATWRELLAQSPPDAPWRSAVEAALARVEPSSAKAGGPSPEDMAAAAALTPEQRAEMIRGMVERLAERLKSDGADVEGWMRLVRAYVVLGDLDRARSAAADARRALAENAEKLGKLDALVKGLGLEG